ncbi:MAG: Ig-like domain-containing protein [Myxococcota bacterium]
MKRMQSACGLTLVMSSLTACPTPLPDFSMLSATGDDSGSSGSSGSSGLPTSSTAPSVDSATTTSAADSTLTSSSGTTAAGELMPAPDDYVIPNCVRKADYPWSPQDGLLDNDMLGDAEVTLTLLERDTEAGGTVELMNDGSFTYSPPGDYAVVDSFSYVIVDDTGQRSEPTLVTLRPATTLQLGLDGDGRFMPIQGKMATRAGLSVAAAGNVNDDDFDDIIIGAHLATANNNTFAGEAYVVFGRSDRATMLSLEDASFAGEGFAIRGANNEDFAGRIVKSAGDVDNDGFDDVLVSAPGYRTPNPDNFIVGRTYLVYGKSDLEEVSLAEISEPDGLLLFEGSEHQDWVGISIDGGTVINPLTGQRENVDINGDGVPDVLLARSRWPSSQDPGSVFWLHDFSTAPQTPNSITTEALRFDSVFENGGGYGIGHELQILGDINDDGAPELVIVSDATTSLPPNSDYAGRVHVALSPTTMTTEFDFVLQGELGDRLGQAVADVDLNNDGYNDLVIGAPGRVYGAAQGGQVYVLYGGPNLTPPATVDDLDDDLDPTRLAIRGDHADTEAGRALADAGDFNGDGLRDLVIGTPLASNKAGPACSDDAASYVIFGFSSDNAPAEISLDEITCDPNGISQGVAILPEPTLVVGTTHCTGWSVAGIGDFDDDGCDDILLSAPINLDRAYIVYGFDPNDPERGCPAQKH